MSIIEGIRRRTRLALLAVVSLLPPVVVAEAKAEADRSRGEGPDARAVEAILTALAEDEAHAFLRTLRPEQDDCDALFRRPRDARLACAYAEAMYEGLDGLREDALKPEREGGATRIVVASPALLESGLAHPMMGRYGPLAARLAPDVTLYLFLFEDGDGRPYKSRGALLRSPERWVFVPEPQKAFES